MKKSYKFYQEHRGSYSLRTGYRDLLKRQITFYCHYNDVVVRRNLPESFEFTLSIKNAVKNELL